MPCHPRARGTVTHRCSPHSILSFLHAESSSVKWLPLHREEGARKTGAGSQGRCGMSDLSANALSRRTHTQSLGAYFTRSVWSKDKELGPTRPPSEPLPRPVPAV